MSARQTYSERRWPDTPEFSSLLRRWKTTGTIILLEIIWKGYDRFRVDALSQVDFSKDDEDLERNITQLLEPKIREVMTGYEPFYVQHGPYEYETRRGGTAQPPQYDIAFILWANPRIMWALEAKVLKTHGSVAEYINEVRTNFLTCRYSPFSSEAAMLGYLLSGDPNILFSNIADRGGWKLITHAHFPDRDHRTSDHERKIPEGKSYPIKFRCHHIVLQFQTL